VTALFESEDPLGVIGELTDEQPSVAGGAGEVGRARNRAYSAT
jgi:hypothetical protein